MEASKDALFYHAWTHLLTLCLAWRNKSTFVKRCWIASLKRNVCRLFLEGWRMNPTLSTNALENERFITYLNIISCYHQISLKKHTLIANSCSSRQCFMADPSTSISLSPPITTNIHHNMFPKTHLKSEHDVSLQSFVHANIKFFFYTLHLKLFRKSCCSWILTFGFIK